MTTNFVYDNSTLPNWPKSDFAVRTDVVATKKVTAADWNATEQALIDIQTVLRGAKWYGVTEQAGDPAPAGITNYLWVRTSDGALMLNAAPVGGAATMSIGGTVTSATAGSILFAAAGPVLAQNNANLNWDNTNFTLGITGGNSSHFALDVHGLDTSGSSNTVRIANNAGGFGLATLQFDNASTHVGDVIGSNSATSGLANGINICATAGKQIGFRQGTSTQIASFDATNTYLNVANTAIGHTTTSTFTLDVRASIASQSVQKIQNLATNGYSALLFADVSGTEKGDVGYANTSVGLTHLQGKNYLYSSGVDWVIATSAAVKFYFDVANQRLGIGKTPSNTLSLAVSATGAGVMDIQNTSATGFSDILFYDSSGTLVGAVGYANSSETAVSSAAGFNMLYTEGGKDWAIINGTSNIAVHVFGVTSGSVHHQMTDGASAGLSAANTCRLRWNNGTGKLQISKSGAAYVDII